MNVATDVAAENGLGRRLRRLTAFALIVAGQFVLFELGLRSWSSSEAAPAFQALFTTDPVIGHKLKPHTTARFTTAEFSADIAINGAGVRDTEEIGPKAADERRILLLGDSLVLAVQVPFEQTFGELLEADLNRRSRGLRYRVINAGVQGYGPVEELLLFRQIARALSPDLVLTFVYTGNDAEEAFGSRGKLDPGNAGSRAANPSESMVTRLRRLVRRSMVLQIVRLRIITATERLTAFSRPEPPVQSYAAEPAPRVAEGIDLTRRIVDTIASESRLVGADNAIVLMPARFQVDDADYGRLREIVRQAGGELVRDAATDRFHAALAGIPEPRLDVLPALRAALPGPDLFFQTTAHLTPHGHRILADALAEFLIAQHLVELGEVSH